MSLFVVARFASSAPHAAEGQNSGVGGGRGCVFQAAKLDEYGHVH